MVDALVDAAPYDEDPPRVGRPRDPRVDAAIRQATLDLLAEDGYQATSIQAIARRAGVSPPTIYRRWSSKAELIEEAVFPTALLDPAELSGDLDTDLETYCRTIIEHLGDPAVRAAIPGLLTEYQTDPELWHRLVQRSVAPMRQAFAAYLQQSGRRPIGSAEALFDLMIGGLFVRAINSGTDDAAAFAHEVALVISAGLQPAKARR